MIILEFLIDEIGHLKYNGASQFKIGSVGKIPFQCSGR